MNKNIYIRDEDAPVWDRARELAGDKLSPVIVMGLKKFISGKEHEAAASKGFDRIEIRYRDHDDGGIPKAKAFTGKWIISIEQPLTLAEEDNGSTMKLAALAITPKGSVVVYSWLTDHEDDYQQRLQIFTSLEEAASNKFANYTVITAMERMGVPVEELDI